MLLSSLTCFMEKDLLNKFVNEVFKYHLKDNEYVYIQYKIVKGNIVLNIFDNGKKNRFKSYVFTLLDIPSDDNTIYINVKDCYDKYNKKRTKNKLYLVGALLFSKENGEKKDIIENISDDMGIKYILYKYFII